MRETFSFYPRRFDALVSHDSSSLVDTCWYTLPPPPPPPPAAAFGRCCPSGGTVSPSPTHTPITAAPMVAVQPWPMLPKRLLPAWTATPTIIICTNRVDPWTLALTEPQTVSD